MRQNKEIFDKYADKLLSAMKREGLMNKEVAEIFHVFPSYMSNMTKHPEKVPERFMEMIRTWAISDKPLRGYQPEDVPDLEAAEMNQQEANEARDTAEMKFRSKLAVKGLLKNHKEDIAAAVAESVNTEEPTGDIQMSVIPVDSYGEPTAREQIAAALRKEFERQTKEPQPQEVTVSVICKNDKVDVSRLDSRTGVIASAELFFDENGAFHLTYKYKS